ncbi:MAG: hypothetical protein SGJ27_01890 [Candidatus Melainabacteria bacterium]|nr:hypothetical protein [Candidatus Melainabacteria bacterium]
MQMDRKLSLTANLIVAALIAGVAQPALAGSNDFFGTSVPEGAGKGATAPARQQPVNPYADPSVPQGDFTTDEKRMQKKYKGSIAHAKGLVAKGERMMKAGPGGAKDKEFKKGKIIKEIGERQLAELSANNPLADILDDKGADRKPKTASTESSPTQ